MQCGKIVSRKDNYDYNNAEPKKELFKVTLFPTSVSMFDEVKTGRGGYSTLSHDI